MKVSDERIRRCAAGEIFLDAAEEEDMARELLAARKVVEAARVHCGYLSPVFDALAAYDAALNQPLQESQRD